MVRGDYTGESPEELYKEAHNMARRSTNLKRGPPQSKVVRRYASAAGGFIEKGNSYMAHQILNEVREFTKDPKLIKMIEDKLKPGARKEEGIEKRFFFASLSIIFLLSALLFTSVSLTGYSVFDLTQNNSRFIGTGLFILGLVFAFLYFKLK